MTPSSAPPLRCSQSSAASRSMVAGERCKPATAILRRRTCPRLLAPLGAARSIKRLAARLRAGRTAMSSAGVSADSLRTRLSAGCSRSCSASNDSASPTGMISSPSRRKRFSSVRAKHFDHFGEVAGERLARLRGQRRLRRRRAEQGSESRPTWAHIASRRPSGSSAASSASIGASVSTRLSICRQSPAACSRSRCVARARRYAAARKGEELHGVRSRTRPPRATSTA